MDIYIKNKQPIPAIYNVKQYTSDVYAFNFYIPKSELSILGGGGSGNITANIKTGKFTSPLTVINEGDFLLLKWQPSYSQTKYAGNFEIQIEIIAGNYIWQSYKAVYVVSDSIDSIEPLPETGNSNNSGVYIGNLIFGGFVDTNPIVGTAIVEEV